VLQIFLQIVNLVCICFYIGFSVYMPGFGVCVCACACACVCACLYWFV